MSKNSNSSPNTGQSSPFPFDIYPNEWIGNSDPNIILIVSGFTTTSGTYTGSDITIKDSTGAQIAIFSFNAVGGNNAITTLTIPMISTPSTNFPWTVTGTITASLGTAQFLQPVQVPISLKPDGTVACYSTTILSNDGGSDNDWNDLVLNFQLFNDSTD